MQMFPSLYWMIMIPSELWAIAQKSVNAYLYDIRSKSFPGKMFKQTRFGNLYHSTLNHGAMIRTIH